MLLEGIEDRHRRDSEEQRNELREKIQKKRVGTENGRETQTDMQLRRPEQMQRPENLVASFIFS